MSVPYPIPVTATQVGTYFVSQYYKVVEQQPDYAHQFYSEASTMLRVQGSSSGSASGLLQIHSMIMSLNHTAYEVRTAHALESWSGGVIVMVSGSVKAHDFRRSFVETFFLAPQEKGYFVLNDVFHFIEEDIYPAGYNLPAEILSKQDTKSNGRIEGNGFSHTIEAPKALRDHFEDQATEPVKHTYASVLRSRSHQTIPADFNHAEETLPIDTFESSGGDPLCEDLSEDEIKSVYVRNLPPDASEPEIEEEFSKFGKIAHEGVVIRSRKDVGVCYAFVEFEEMSGVNNAVKAGGAMVCGRQVYIEERRPNSNIPSLIARRGRGRGSFQMSPSRGRSSRSTLGHRDNFTGLRENGNGFVKHNSRSN